MTGYTLSRNQKLLQSGEFKRVFDRADYKVGTPVFLLLARKNDLGRARLGLVVGKKNANLAVSRNRIKRQVRESFRLWQHQLPSVDIIFLARKGAEVLPRQELRQQLERGWGRLVRQAAPGERSSCAG